MSFSAELAEIRFGCGLSPVVAPPARAEDMLAGLVGPDIMATTYPIERYETFRKRLAASEAIRKQMRDVRGTPQHKTLAKERKRIKRVARKAMLRWMAQGFLRQAHSPHAFRERLTLFWADHFTAVGKNGPHRWATSPYIEDAIRPNLTGRFADLLVAAVSHPLMLNYLDQEKSMGPASPRAIKSNGKYGLNENLAREVLELHTLGVDGPYSQDDVRQLAELFTGMSAHPNTGFRFRKGFAEPGPETVLGRQYGGARADFAAIRQALDDLSVHPATARHMARKLAVHFVADRPDAALVSALEARWTDTGGNLTEVYAALLDHPAAWRAAPENVKPPADFVGSAFRALAVSPAQIDALPVKELNRSLMQPLSLMGQLWQHPVGPDGWAEDDDAWITPQGLAARVHWAMTVPQLLSPDLPDPRDFVRHALGQSAPQPVTFAVRAAESRADAIGIVLSSPAFQRR